MYIVLLISDIFETSQDISYILSTDFFFKKRQTYDHLIQRFGDYEDDEWSGLNVVDDSSNSSYNPTKYELNDEEYNNLEMEFEKFVSEQKVFLFGRNINISMIF